MESNGWTITLLEVMMLIGFTMSVKSEMGNNTSTSAISSQTNTGNKTSTSAISAGQIYTGSCSTTKTGRTCQRWDSNTPHSHDYNASALPDRTLADAANYCRDVFQTGSPVCYTTDENKRWEACDIERCVPILTGSSGGNSTTCNITESGRTCQRWDSNTPHSHRFRTETFPDDTVSQAENYCRDPDQMGYLWCYTTNVDKRWDRCTCPPIRMNTTLYAGTCNTTESGNICQRWDSNTPHSHQYFASQIAENYCSDPDQMGYPWCYTTDVNKRWERCNITHCQLNNPSQQIYNGTCNVTESGRVCQRWDSNTPHRHTTSKSAGLPEATLTEAKNFCRDIYSNGSSWCYTVDIYRRWEICNITTCAFISTVSMQVACEEEGLSTGIVIGFTSAGLLLLLIVISIFVLLFRRHAVKKQNDLRGRLDEIALANVYHPNDVGTLPTDVTGNGNRDAPQAPEAEYVDMDGPENNVLQMRTLFERNGGGNDHSTRNTNTGGKTVTFGNVSHLESQRSRPKTENLYYITPISGPAQQSFNNGQAAGVKTSPETNGEYIYMTPPAVEPYMTSLPVKPCDKDGYMTPLPINSYANIDHARSLLVESCDTGEYLTPLRSQKTM